jgi:steroid 5-alpha reductase family enzyme
MVLVDPDWLDYFAGHRFAGGLGACVVALAVLFGMTFALARKLGKHSVVDVAWGLGFVTVAVTTFLESHNAGTDSRRHLISGMVLVWGARLAWHIGRRNAGHGEDPRYRALLQKVPRAKRNAYALRMIYGSQALLILFISLPVQVAQYYRSYDVPQWVRHLPPGTRINGFGIPERERGLGWVAVAGLALWAIGLFFEAVGDRQLKRFKADPANQGKIMDRGLWRCTRHPNYFGDACVWWGIWLVAAEAGKWGALTVLSPVVMTLFLTKGSGAALTEKRMAGRPGFAEYVARTSGFVPLPPRHK